MDRELQKDLQKQEGIRRIIQEATGDSIRDQNAILTQAFNLGSYLETIDEISIHYTNDSLARKVKQALIQVTRDACDDIVEGVNK